jgi:DNA-binding transcriptional LysR family regulator
MSDLRNNEIRRLDLTLLLVFLGLIRLRKASEVAAELGLTQSAVSQALKRLRDIFGDELFLRRSHGMEPTSVALALEAPVAAAVDSVRAALERPKPFDPARAAGIIRMAALDAEQAFFVPPLLRRLQDEAPGLQLSVLPFARRAALESLENNIADIAVGFLWDVPDRFVQAKLGDQGFLVVGKGAFFNEKSISLERYASARHILVSPAGEMRGVVDSALEALGLSRRILAAVPQFFPALSAVAETDSIATLPEHFARKFAPALGLETAEPPVSLRRFPVLSVIHKRNALDGRLNWFNSILKDIARSDSEMP